MRVRRFCTATPTSCRVESTLCNQAVSENVELCTDCSKKTSSRKNTDLMEALPLASIDALLWWVVSHNLHNLLLLKLVSFCLPIMLRSQTKTKWIRIKLIFTIEYWAFLGWLIHCAFWRACFLYWWLLHLCRPDSSLTLQCLCNPANSSVTLMHKAISMWISAFVYSAAQRYANIKTHSELVPYSAWWKNMALSVCVYVPNHSSPLVLVHWPDMWWTVSKGAANQLAFKVQNWQHEERKKPSPFYDLAPSAQVNSDLSKQCLQMLLDMKTKRLGHYLFRLFGWEKNLLKEKQQLSLDNTLQTLWYSIQKKSTLLSDRYLTRNQISLV